MHVELACSCGATMDAKGEVAAVIAIADRFRNAHMRCGTVAVPDRGKATAQLIRQEADRDA